MCAVVDPERDVAAQRVVDQRDRLRHVPEPALPRTLTASHVLAVHEQAARRGREQAEEDVDERALARPRRPDEPDRFTARDGERDAIECRASLLVVGVRDVLEDDGVGEREGQRLLRDVGRLEPGQAREVVADDRDVRARVLQERVVHRQAIGGRHQPEACVCIQRHQAHHTAAARRAARDHDHHHEHGDDEDRLDRQARAGRERGVAPPQHGMPAAVARDAVDEVAFDPGDADLPERGQRLLHVPQDVLVQASDGLAEPRSHAPREDQRSHQQHADHGDGAQRRQRRRQREHQHETCQRDELGGDVDGRAQPERHGGLGRLRGCLDEARGVAPQVEGVRRREVRAHQPRRRRGHGSLHHPLLHPAERRQQHRPQDVERRGGEGHGEHEGAAVPIVGRHPAPHDGQRRGACRLGERRPECEGSASADTFHKRGDAGHRHEGGP